MAEKTEKPTHKRLKDSAKKGQTFKSKDLITTIILLGGVYFLTHWMMLNCFIDFYSHLLLNFSTMPLQNFLKSLLFIFFQISLPFIGICIVIGAISTLLQTKFSLATEAIKINFRQLNPITGIKKIFSLRTAKELVKSICYIVVFIATCYTFMHDQLKLIFSIRYANMMELINIWRHLVMNIIMLFVGWSSFVLLADFIIEYFLFFKELKMDKHEVKREYKELDGNPEIKRARRQAHFEILSGSEMAAIRNSKVILTNPTHIAIAIYFNPEVALFPFIALRCKNIKAKAAITYAKKSGVPVVRYVPLARKLYSDYRQYSFISVNDNALMEVMDILIWLQQVEQAGMDAEFEEKIVK